MSYLDIFSSAGQGEKDFIARIREIGNDLPINTRAEIIKQATQFLINAYYYDGYTKKELKQPKAHILRTYPYKDFPEKKYQNAGWSQWAMESQDNRSWLRIVAETLTIQLKPIKPLPFYETTLKWMKAHPAHISPAGLTPFKNEKASLPRDIRNYILLQIKSNFTNQLSYFIMAKQAKAAPAAKPEKKFPDNLLGLTVEKVEELGNGYYRITFKGGICIVVQLVPLDMKVLPKSEPAPESDDDDDDDDDEDRDAP